MKFIRLIGRVLADCGLSRSYGEQRGRLRQINMLGLRYGVLFFSDKEY